MHIARVALPALALVFTLLIGLAPAGADNLNRVSVGIGYYDVFDDHDAADFRVEYRPGTSIIWELRPWLGAEITSDGAVYGAAGFLYDFHLTPQWILTPSLGAGLYADGSGKDLGNAIECQRRRSLAHGGLLEAE